jgi:hypothetical protein
LVSAGSVLSGWQQQQRQRQRQQQRGLEGSSLSYQMCFPYGAMSAASRTKWLQHSAPALSASCRARSAAALLCRKTCSRPVDEDLRATLKAFCTGLVAALNKYYAFGSVFAEEV